ncbi:MAG: hypothetical protein WCW84_14290, partial [Sulfurimonas sp.]
MNEMVKQPIFFLTPEAIKNIYKNRELIEYNNIGVQLDQKLILSQVMYKTKKITKSPYTLHVNPQSFIYERQKIINYFIEEIIIPCLQNGKSLRTSTSKIQKIITFIHWADREDILFTGSKKEARKALEAYTLFLKSNIRTSKLSQGEAHSRHSSSMHFLRSVHDDGAGEITIGIKNIPNKRDSKIVKSTNADISYSFNFYHAFFSQVADFLLQGQKYPFQLKLPAESLWVIPSSNWIKPNHQENEIMAFDYAKGKIRGGQEIKDRYGLKYLRDGRWARNNLLKAIGNNNADLSSAQRLKLGAIAIRAYFMHFLAITGMNDSTAATLPWAEEYDIEKTKQKFRNVKYRAGNKIVEFQIQREFINDFQKYLKLREFVLDGTVLDSLFFTRFGKNAVVSNNQRVGSFSSNINRYMIKHIDQNLPKINSKQSRVNKTHQVIKQNGLIAASQLAQSSKNTIIKHYLGESEESSTKQLTSYFDELNNKLFTTNGE